MKRTVALTTKVIANHQHMQFHPSSGKSEKYIICYCNFSVGVNRFVILPNLCVAVSHVKPLSLGSILFNVT
jgi:hypothetical protein